MSRLLTVLLIALPSLLSAQAVPEPVRLSRSLLIAQDAPAAPIPAHAVRMSEPSPHRLRNALIGGVIGAAAGAIVCTAISNIADDAAVDRFTTCTADGYLVSSGVGFGAGFLIGWLVSS